VHCDRVRLLSGDIGDPNREEEQKGGKMSSRWKKRVVSCLLVLTLAATLGLGCGGDEAEGKVTITIGHITDITGPAAPALGPMNWCIDDIVRYINEEDPIPGVTLKVYHFDARYPSRDVPGWDACLNRGAQVVVTPLPTTAQTLKPFAKRDSVPLITLTASQVLIDPPEWVFCMNAPVEYQIKALLKWIWEEGTWDQSQGPAKIGAVGWDEPYVIDMTRGIEDYCTANPTQFTFVAGPRAPMGVTDWSGEVQTLKNCDFVALPQTGLGTSTFAKQYREQGGAATFVGPDGFGAYRGLVVDSVDWDDLDGTLSGNAATRWWGDETGTIVELAERLLIENHPDDAAEVIHSGIGYIGGFHQYYGFLSVLRKALENVAPEDFTGQDFYDTAIAFSEDSWEGYETWEFSATKRYSWNYICVLEWQKETQDLVRIVDEWLPNIVS